MPKTRLPLLLALTLTPCTALATSTPVIDPEIVHIDAASSGSDDFGAAIAGLNGSVAVGAPLTSTDAIMDGQVVLFRSLFLTDVISGRSVESWQNITLTPGTDARNSTKFGSAVAVADDYLAVGAPGWWGDEDSKSGSGAVMLYDIGWSTGAPPHLATLEQPSPEIGDHFGAALASDNNDSVTPTRFAVGTPGRRTPGSSISDAGGAVFIYEFNPVTEVWALTASFQPADVQSDDEYGTSVSLAGDFLAIGAPGRNSGAGAVYLYHYDQATSTWDHVDVIDAAETTCAAEFGRAVELWSNRLVIGGEDHASLYFLSLTGEIGTVSYSQTLEPGETAVVSDWGRSVSIDEDRLMVGSEGQIGLFRRGATMDYDLLALLDGSAWNAENDDDLGTAVCVRGTQAWAGAPDANAAGSNSGAAVRWDVRGMPGCPTDVDWDYDVDGDDLLLLLTEWGNSSWALDESMDVNADEAVDIHDLMEVLTTWGSCS